MEHGAQRGRQLWLGLGPLHRHAEPFYLVGVSTVAITDVVPQIFSVPPNPTEPLKDAENTFTVGVSVTVWLPKSATVTVVAAGSWSDNAVVATTLTLPAGESRVGLSLTAVNVTLWWPHTHGTPTLYALNVTASITPPTSSFAATSRRVGFRSIALVAIANNEQYYRVNGVGLFVMGANWVPPDAFQQRVTDARLRDMLLSVVDGNMNLLRVWGGGVYNHDPLRRLARVPGW